MLIWIESPFDNLPHEGFRRERYWLMAEAFVAAGHTVHYWTMDFNHGTKAKRVYTEGVLTPIELHTIESPAYRKNVSLRRAYSHAVYAHRLELAASEAARHQAPAIVIAATPTLGSARVMATLAKRYQATFVLDIQDAWPETFARLLPRPFRFLAKFLFLPLYRTAKKLYAEADIVTGVSERYAGLSQRDDFYLAYHGIPNSSYCLPSTSFTSSCSLVYVGNLGAGYNLDPVLAAMVYNPEWTLEIAGRGPQEARLVKLVDKLKLGERVHFHGYLNSEALQALLKTCTVGIIPMRNDSWVGLPYKLGDYLAAGLIVISSLNGECGELLRRYRLGVTYDYYSYQSFGAAMEALRNLSFRKNEPPEFLRADRIYPKYVAEIISRAKTCP